MDVMGIEMVEGRNFNQYDSAGVTVVTRYMMDQFGIMPGDILPEAGEVIGICENVRFNSVREPNTPIAFIPLTECFTSASLPAAMRSRPRPI